MPDALPLLPINQDQLQHLIAALLVYRLYLLRKALPTEERMYLRNADGQMQKALPVS